MALIGGCEGAVWRGRGVRDGTGAVGPGRRGARGEAQAGFEAREESEVVGDHGGPDVGLEVVEAAPGAAGEAVGALEAGDVGASMPARKFLSLR